MSPAVLAVMLKEARQVTRDRRVMAMLVIAPVIQLYVLGLAANFDVDRIATVVCDLDRTAESRALARSLFADGTFLDLGAARDCSRPDEDVREGLAKAAVVLPAGLARDVAAGRTVEVQFLVDGSDPVVGQFARTAAEGWVASESAARLRPRVEALQATMGRALSVPMVQALPRILYNPSMKSAIFLVPGVSAMILLLVTMVVTAMGIAREREMGTLEQVLVTPLRPVELMVGKVAPFVIVGLFDVLLALVIATTVFGVPVRGSLWLVWLGTLLYLMSTVGLGLLISTVSRSQQQAFMGGFFVMMPLLLLSGVMTPIANMPVWLQPLTWVIPVRYYVEILRGVLLKGAGIPDLWTSFAALAAFGPVILGFAVARFRKRLE